MESKCKDSNINSTDGRSSRISSGMPVSRHASQERWLRNVLVAVHALHEQAVEKTVAVCETNHEARYTGAKRYHDVPACLSALYFTVL